MPGTNLSDMTVVTDADALIALVNDQDLLHEKAVQLSQFLLEKKAQVLFPVTAVMEAAAKLQRTLHNPEKAAQLLELMFEEEKYLIGVDTLVFKKAREFFDHTATKRNTIFDCVVVSLAKKYQTKIIFSFDDWYPKLGLMLVADVF